LEDIATQIAEEEKKEYSVFGKPEATDEVKSFDDRKAEIEKKYSSAVRDLENRYENEVFKLEISQKEASEKLEQEHQEEVKEFKKKIANLNHGNKVLKNQLDEREKALDEALLEKEKLTVRAENLRKDLKDKEEKLDNTESEYVDAENRRNFEIKKKEEEIKLLELQLGKKERELESEKSLAEQKEKE
jgi:hypothetical protein